MSKISVLIDSCIYIAWLNKELEYNNIDKIKTFVKNGKIKVITTIDIRLEIVNGRNGNADWKKIENAFQPITHILTPNFIIGDTDGSYKAYLTQSKQEWKNLANSTNNTKDTKHFISGKNLGAAEFFLSLDNKFFNKMQQTKKIYKNISLIKPFDLIQEVNKRNVDIK